MEPRQPSLAPDGLLRDSAWVRDLARWMIRDVHLADDLSQEALLRAWEQAGRSGDGTLGTERRPWARAVIRNLARMHWRAKERREEREAGHARPVEVPSSEEAVRRAELQQQVVQAVLQLDEPYRTTILLRFLEERSVAEVAERMGVPASTVRVRSKRALARLQSGLFLQSGDDPRAYLTGLCLLAGLPRAGAGAGAATTSTLLSGSHLMPKLAFALFLAVSALSAVAIKSSFFSPAEVELAGGEQALFESPSSAPDDRGQDTTPAAGGRSAPRQDDQRRALAPGARAEREAPTEDRARRGRGRLQGQVIDAEGRPLEGVSIDVFPQTLRAGTAPAFAAVRELVSAADGTFVAADLTGFMTYGLRFEKPGFVAQVENAIAREIPEVRLYRSGTLRGRVLSSDGVTPVADVRLVLGVARRRGIASYTTTSAADGSFEVAGLPIGLSVTIEAFAGPGLPSEYDALVQAEGDSMAELVLRERASLAGRVVDFETGEGVPFATLRAGVQSTDVAQTDAEGRFQLQLDARILSAAPTDQKIEPKWMGEVLGGWLGENLRVAAAGYVDTSTPLWSAAPELGLPFQVPLLRGSTIAGRVTQTDGSPAAGTLVAWTDVPFRDLGAAAWAWPRNGSVQTDSEGRYELAGVPAAPTSTGLLAFRAADGEAYFESAACPAKIGATHALDVVLGSQPVVSGRVFLNGEPAAAYVYVAAAAGARELQTRTDTDGNFVLDGLSTGVHQVHACTADGSALWSELVEVTVPPQSAEPLRLDILAEVRTVSGRVTDTSGAPVEGVRVLAHPQRQLGQAGRGSILAGFAETDAAGYFRVPLSEYDGEAVTIAAVHEQSTFELLDVQPGADALAFVLPAFAPVELVLSAEDAAKLSSVTVRWRERLSNTTARVRGGQPQALSSAGRLRLRLPIGLIDLEIVDPATGRRASLVELTTTVAEKPQEVRVELRRP